MIQKTIIQKIFFFRTLVADILYGMSENKDIINGDIIRYLDETPFTMPGKRALNYCLIFNKPFRNIFYYRTREHHFMRAICRLFLKPVMTVEITGGLIGEGFRIDHNYCVTIGKGKVPNENGLIQPILGDNVDVYPNAVIFGGIRIGNNVKIGAGAVVNKDVPDNCTVVGNPMRIIRYENGKKSEV